LAAIVALLGAQRATAEPVDLSNPESRWVQVRFEISPPDQPLRTKTSYSRDLPARLDGGADAGEIKITIDRELVERHLLSGHEPVPGSFSDFVWRFEASSGHVRSATLTGTVVRRLEMGLSRWQVNAPIDVQMDTASPAGFDGVRNVFGLRFHRFCTPRASSRCRSIEASRYDPETGYVNALGFVSARSTLVRIRSFSPLGEAIFSEAQPRLAADGSPTAPVSLAPPAAALN